jgi:endo-beta-N-acetylglucosaminidase D
VDASRKMLENPNAMQTLIEYGKTYQLSEYTIKWYNTMVDNNNDPIHETYTMPVHVK